LGVSEVDFSGYPDCRFDAITALQHALVRGLGMGITINTPWIRASKAAALTWCISNCDHTLDVLAISHTCYAGQVPPCKECDACRLRQAAFDELGIPDPLIEATVDVHDDGRAE
jgi:7-cyano-7-deazaguanine synthase